MDDHLEGLFEETIQDEIEEMRDMEVGTEEHKVAVDGVTKLTDRLIELKKVRIESENEKLRREDELSCKQQEMANDQKDRLIKNWLTGLSIVTGVGLTVWGTLKSLKFEETGTVTTIVGRGFINKLLPKK